MPADAPEPVRSYPQAPDTDGDADPRLAIRRRLDRCFHRVEEVVSEGYIVDGILIARDEVAEVAELDESGAPKPNCRRAL